MEHIAALLLIVACSDDLQQCRELPAPTPLYETVEECENVLPQALNTFTGKHPQLFAQCVFVDPAMEEEDAELTWDIGEDGTLHASIGAPETAIASNDDDR
ncbi:hypothetical protein [Pseudaminobacter sp. NGMCC 1.201702]|uniref:hypothetical protein n=1 Tax=Pseudaminobacter sp. NGMCC 1.201702 TaxID=3391825 RepID=UPI0039EEF537